MSRYGADLDVIQGIIGRRPQPEEQISHVMAECLVAFEERVKALEVRAALAIAALDDARKTGEG